MQWEGKGHMQDVIIFNNFRDKYFLIKGHFFIFKCVTDVVGENAYFNKLRLI